MYDRGINAQLSFPSIIVRGTGSSVSSFSISFFSCTPSSTNLRAPGRTLALQRADRLVVVLDAARQLPADAVHVRDKRTQATVQVLGQDPNLLRVIGQRKLPPAVGDGFQQCDETGRRGQNDLLRQRVLDQVRFLVERGAQELVAGNEQDDELRALSNWSQ